MTTSQLHPGQRVLMGPAPRFGLPRYVRAEFDIPEAAQVRIAGQVDEAFTLTRASLDVLPEVSMDSDLHCVMTWSAVGTGWTGWRFTDLWERRLRDHAADDTTHLVFSGLDGAVASIEVGDLLRDDVMLAHSREGAPLGRAYGAPYRLVVPHLYGYKHIKHVCAIELTDHHVRGPHEPWIMHRRGRVAEEERSGLGMARVTRSINRAFVTRALRSYGVDKPRFR
ncbi:MAG: molybdopterin-dependent oxidoreductase [Ornithinimicrobium sp.]